MTFPPNLVANDVERAKKVAIVNDLADDVKMRALALRDASVRMKVMVAKAVMVGTWVFLSRSQPATTWTKRSPS